MQQRQSRFGIALREFLDLGLHAELGCACGSEYVRERLGMSERTARELVRVAHAVQSKSPLLASAAMPRPRDAKRAHNGERQMCAADTPDDELWGVTGRIHVSFVAPFSVSVLFRSVMQGFAAPTEPRWKAFERMLQHVLAQDRAHRRTGVAARKTAGTAGGS
jgi:hypothetical protein